MPRSPQTDAGLSFTHCQDPLSPHDPVLVGTFLPVRQGGWLSPQRKPGLAAVPELTPKAQLRRWDPGSHGAKCSRLGHTPGTWAAGSSRTMPATFSAAPVKTADFRRGTMQAGLGGLCV